MRSVAEWVGTSQLGRHGKIDEASQAVPLHLISSLGIGLHTVEAIAHDNASHSLSLGIFQRTRDIEISLHHRLFFFTVSATSVAVVLSTTLWIIGSISCFPEMQGNSYSHKNAANEDDQACIHLFFIHFSSYTIIFSYSLHDRSDRVTGTLGIHEESLGTAKFQEHIQANRDVVLIVRDIEIHYLLPLLILIFLIFQTQTAVLDAVICLHGHLAAILELRRSASATHHR